MWDRLFDSGCRRCFNWKNRPQSYCGADRRTAFDRVGWKNEPSVYDGTITHRIWSGDWCVTCFRKIIEIVTVHAGTWHLLPGCAPENEFCEQQQKFDIGAAVQNVRRLFMVWSCTLRIRTIYHNDCRKWKLKNDIFAVLNCPEPEEKWN